jgi:hypothetical protein
VIEKCDEKRVREIIKDELWKVENNEDTVDGATQNIRAKTVKKEAGTIVIDEMNERKSTCLHIPSLSGCIYPLFLGPILYVLKFFSCMWYKTT